MSALDNIEARVQEITSPVLAPNGDVLPRPLNTHAEIRLYVADVTRIQQSLRLLKSQVVNESRGVSNTYANKSANVSSHPVFAGLFGRKRAAHVSALDRQRIRNSKHNALAPYRGAITYIDSMIQGLEELKIKVKALLL